MRIGERGIVPSTGKGLDDGDVSRDLPRTDTPGKSDDHNQVAVEPTQVSKALVFHYRSCGISQSPFLCERRYSRDK